MSDWSSSTTPSEWEANSSRVTPVVESLLPPFHLSISDELNLDREKPPTDSTSSSAPPTELELLKTALYRKSDREVLEHCFGLKQLEGVSQAAQDMIVVCFDTESWTQNHDKITEIGVATFESRDMRDVGQPGKYGENLLKQVYFYHARIKENAHLINIKYCIGNPDDNRFGQTRFLDKEQACSMLTDMFAWPSSDLPGPPFCPVVILGHALSGDLSMLQKTLGFSASQLGTVVKAIDTQQLAREVGYAPNSRNSIGLRNLVGLCGFQYRDAHTASNDAAMTLICAVQMVLPDDIKTGRSPSLQDIINDVETTSQFQDSDWGTDKYCIRCGQNGHTKNQYQGRKQCRVPVNCRHCRFSKNEKRTKAANSHRTECCITFLLYGAEETRLVTPGRAEV